jgi:hypothetical protein
VRQTVDTHALDRLPPVGQKEGRGEEAERLQVRDEHEGAGRTRPEDASGDDAALGRLAKVDAGAADEDGADGDESDRDVVLDCRSTGAERQS